MVGKEKVGGFWSPLFDLFWPRPEIKGDFYRLQEPFCQRCGQPYAGGIVENFHCFNCSEFSCHYERARAPFLSRGVVRNILHRFKYEREFWLNQMMIDWLREGFERFYATESYAALVPVPLFRLRQRWREFNQAFILAKGLSRKIHLPVWDVLHRIRETRIQAKLDRKERRRNVRDAFVLANSEKVRDTALLMIDDVFTTGSTANECARVLKAAGARKVDVLTIARG